MSDVVLESIDDLPEPLHDLFEQNGEGWRLKEFEPAEEVEGLKSALETERSARKQLDRQLRETKSRLPEDFDPDEWKKLRAEARKREEEKAKAEGRWEELRTKLQQEEKEKRESLQAEFEEKLKQRDAAIHDLTVKTDIRSALSEAGFLPESHDMLEAYFERQGADVEWTDDGPRGVIPDDLHGPKPISEAVKEFAGTEAAEIFLKKGGATGGGASPGGSGGGGTPPKKNRSDMSKSEKVKFISEHGQDAFLALPE